MDQPSAIILTDGYLTDDHAKTAHGLIRGPSRYAILGVVDAAAAGADAGQIIDGRMRQIPVAAHVEELLPLLEQKPNYCVVGVATSGGRFTQGLLDELVAAARSGISLVNGLHQRLEDQPLLRELAKEQQLELLDLRQSRDTAELSFWSGQILRLPTMRIAVLGTDCALGKRTTCQLLVAALRQRRVQAEMIYTGQTGWLQGGKYGFILDATPNDFVSGELERAILACAEEAQPEVILLEGQSALRHPSGPCGAELLLSGAAHGVILQHAPGRLTFSGLEPLGCRLPSLSSEIALIRAYGVEVWAVALNEGGLSDAELSAVASRLSCELELPVVLPLRGGAEPLAEMVCARLRLMGNKG
jgi:uncharacterized NAD-dependent epimerase/dehydratase family protein